MVSFSSLQISGYAGEPVPNTYQRQADGGRDLGIMLPGIRYSCQMPLLFYPSRLLLNQGADVLWVEYAYYTRPSFNPAPGSDDERRLVTDVAAACRGALAARSYERVSIVGKSLASLAMARVLESEPTLAEARAVWLTPLLRDPRVREALEQTRQPALVVIGTADDHYDVDILRALEARGRRVMRLEGADHSIEIEDDLGRSLKVMADVLQAIEAFLSDASPDRQPRRGGRGAAHSA